ncbi:MAG: hypothetical protein GX572_05770 [Clostridia bacterium]|nr:hypothetical protein [Clostridia bacterium]
MTDYRQMYFALFNALTTAIEQLQQAQCESGKAYMETGATPLVVLLGEIIKEPQAGI